MSIELPFAAFTAPMREELTRLGFTELKTPEAVDAELRNLKGTAVVFVNSTCGCAGGTARPAMAMTLENAGKRPEKLLTVFASTDREATARAREYFTGYAPSSPSIALLRDGKIVGMIERHEIQGEYPQTVARRIMQMFEENC